MNITWVGMTRQHYQQGSSDRVRAVVLHATAGRHPGDLSWLRHGGDDRRPVSCHYYIDKAGRISQFVKDEDIAWHAGRSRWAVDGRVVENLNAVSIGIELENLNTGRDPYPEIQVEAALELTRELVARYRVPRGQLVRHLDISPGRKTDPAGFSWRSFVARVYEGMSGVVEDPQAQLRALMLDLAYRAAGAALPAGWPLLEAARRQDLGLPVAVISGSSLTPPGRSAQDDRDRAVRLEGQPPLIVEVYARDLLYAPVVGPGDEPVPAAQVRRLASTLPGPLRDALLGLLFRSADPVSGFQPGWAFHQYYLEHAEDLGVPIGPSHRIVVGPRQAFACQHFALDSVCSPVGSWKTVYRPHDLTKTAPGLDKALAAALRTALLDDLYRARAGRRYDRAALVTAQAEARRLGAPLGRPEVVTVNEEPYLLMPYALDVLACRLPELDWAFDRPLPADTSVTGLRDTSGALLGASAPPLALSGGTGGQGQRLLAAPSPHPLVLDLSSGARGRPRRTQPAPDVVLIATASGPANTDLRHEAVLARWHYYIDTAGAVYRLCDELFLAAAPMADRAIVVAVEGGPGAAGRVQRAALTWLIRFLTAALAIPPGGVRALPVGSPAAVAIMQERGL